MTLPAPGPGVPEAVREVIHGLLPSMECVSALTELVDVLHEGLALETMARVLAVFPAPDRARAHADFAGGLFLAVPTALAHSLNGQRSLSVVPVMC